MFHGFFQDALKKVIDLGEYNKRKDEAILSIGRNSIKEENNQDKLELHYFKNAIANIRPFEMAIKSRQDLARWLGVSIDTLENWKKRYKNTPIPKRYESSIRLFEQNINYKGVNYKGVKNPEQLETWPLITIENVKKEAE